MIHKLTNLLLEPAEGRLKNRQLSSLIELMTYCIEEAAAGDRHVGHGPDREVSCCFVKISRLNFIEFVIQHVDYNGRGYRKSSYITI
jgi:hypothetical protein